MIDNGPVVPTTSSYDAWGTPSGLVDSDDTYGLPLAYTGLPYDQEAAGLTQAHARWYDASQGCFVSRDPLGGSRAAPASQNRYAYAQDNPTTLMDPSGLGTISGAGGPTQASQSLSAANVVLTPDIQQQLASGYDASAAQITAGVAAFVFGLGTVPTVIADAIKGGQWLVGQLSAGAAAGAAEGAAQAGQAAAEAEFNPLNAVLNLLALLSLDFAMLTIGFGLEAIHDPHDQGFWTGVAPAINAFMYAFLIAQLAVWALAIGFAYSVGNRLLAGMLIGVSILVFGMAMLTLAFITTIASETPR